MSELVAVTGANGFVGRALCAAMESSGIAVRPLVRRAVSGSAATAVGEIGASTEWSEALAGVGCVIHCAARVHVLRDSARDTLSSLDEVNVAGTRRLAEQAAVMGVRRLVFLSSVKVNGDSTQPGAPFSIYSAVAPQDSYGASKWKAERALLEISAATGLEVVIVRPPLVYGAGVRANFLKLMRLVELGIPLPFGKVGNRRSLVAVSNLVDLLITCITHPAANRQTFFVSDGRDLSTPELIRALAAAMGKEARLLSLPLPLLRLGGRISGRRRELERLMGSLQVDIHDTCEMLDWTPPVTVEDGLKSAVAQGAVAIRRKWRRHNR